MNLTLRESIENKVKKFDNKKLKKTKLNSKEILMSNVEYTKRQDETTMVLIAK